MSSSVPLGSALRQFAKDLLELLGARVELVSNEWETEAAHWRLACVAGIGVFFFAMLGCIGVSALLVVAYWDHYHLEVLSTLALAFTLAALVCARVALKTMANKPKLFAATLEALHADRVALAALRIPSAKSGAAARNRDRDDGAGNDR